MSRISKLKPSRFNLELPLSGDYPGLTVVYNTYTQALCVFETSIWEAIRSGSREQKLRPYLERCRQQLFLVEEGLDETRLLLARKQELAYHTRTFYFKVMVTDHCNFACAYCSEEGWRGRNHMKESVARQTVQFIIDQIKLHRPRELFLDFGGGEPLLNSQAMLLIGEQVHLYCRGARIDFNMAFTTNGFLLAPGVVERLKRAGLSLVRVTLLPRQIHDRLRRTRKGEPTFNHIVDNLASVKHLTDIHILAQYHCDDPQVVELIPGWLGYLEAKGLREAIKDVHFSPILRREYGIKHPDDFCGDLGSYQQYRMIRQAVKEQGYPVTDGPPSTDCLANRKARMVIDAAGSLKVCPAMLGHPELDMGDVWRGVDPVKESQVLIRSLPSSCLEQCVLAPRCNGGCRQQALVRTGSFDGIHCNYDFHLAQLKDYLLQRAHSFLSNHGDRLAA